MPSNSEKFSKLIKQTAYDLGFLSCGISKAEFLETEAIRLENWLNNNYHGEMSYMANHFDKRLDPRMLVDGAKSVISLTYNYFTDQAQLDETAPKISKYAFGEDYHTVIKDKLILLLETIQLKIGEVNGRCFIDSAPVLDKAWAKKSGLGWIGKNSNLIAKKHGSFFFLAEIIIDLDLNYDSPFSTDHCGSCTKCIDACPTDAIIAPYQVDGSKCISYLTIELKNEIPTSFKGKLDNWAFGCDVCQDVCPWNRFSIPHKEPRFEANELLLSLNKKELEEITEEVFTRVFKKSAVKRTKYAGFTRNIEFLKPIR